MSDQPLVPGTSNTFERIKRASPQGHDFWSARELARVLEYSDFRNFATVVEKAKEACAKSGHAVADHFGEITEMVGIGSGALRPVEDWKLSRYACYLVIPNADPSKPLVALGQTIRELGGTMPENLLTAESIKKVESREKKRLQAEQKKAAQSPPPTEEAENSP